MMKGIPMIIENGHRQSFTGSARRSSLGNINVDFCKENKIPDKPVSARRRSIHVPLKESAPNKMVDSEETTRDSKHSDRSHPAEEEFCAVPYDDACLESIKYEEYVEETKVDADDNSKECTTDNTGLLVCKNDLMGENISIHSTLINHSGLTLEKIDEESLDTEEDVTILERIDQIESDDETVIFNKEEMQNSSKEVEESLDQVQNQEGCLSEDFMSSVQTKPAKALKQTKWMKLRQKFGKLVSKGSENDSKQTKVTTTVNVISSPPTESDLFKPKLTDTHNVMVSAKKGRSQSLVDFRKSSSHQLSSADLAHLQKLNERAIKKKKPLSRIQERQTDTITKSVQIQEGKESLSDLAIHSTARLRSRRVSLDVNYLAKASAGVSKEELLGMKSAAKSGKEELYTLFEEEWEDSDTDDYELDDKEYDFYRILEDPNLFKLYVKH